MQIFVKTITMTICNIIASISGATVKPAILMYHSFDDEGWKHGVSPKNLEKQLVYLKKKREVVALTDIVAHAKNKKEVPVNSVAITVDDGYEDTYTVLFPLAKKYSFPFTLFLTTDLSTQPKLGNLARPTWGQLKEMSDSGLVNIQVHGHSHINFPQVLEQRIQEKEIEGCRKVIAKKLGTNSTMLAYPAGKYNQQVLDYVLTSGYEAAFVTRMGVVKKGDNSMILQRIVVDRNTLLKLFKLRLGVGFGLYLRFIKVFRKFLRYWL